MISKTWFSRNFFLNWQWIHKIMTRSTPSLWIDQEIHSFNNSIRRIIIFLVHPYSILVRSIDRMTNQCYCMLVYTIVPSLFFTNPSITFTSRINGWKWVSLIILSEFRKAAVDPDAVAPQFGGGPSHNLLARQKNWHGATALCDETWKIILFFFYGRFRFRTGISSCRIIFYPRHRL
jgi:hypothetical protein